VLFRSPRADGASVPRALPAGAHRLAVVLPRAVALPVPVALHLRLDRGPVVAGVAPAASQMVAVPVAGLDIAVLQPGAARVPGLPVALRSEEHTSELQSRENLVCR